MYGYGSPSSLSRLAGVGTGGVIALILGIILGIIVYFIFVKKDRTSYEGKVRKLHDVLNFRKLYLESFIKILYVICAIFIAVFSIVLLFTSGSFGAGLLAFIFTLVIGEVVTRLIYESAILILKGVGYLRDIRDDAEEIRQYARTGDSGRTTVAPASVDEPEMADKL